MEKTVSFGIHELVNRIQSEHGINLRDYLVYRQYCTRRIRRLRKYYKLTNFTGKKKSKVKFKGKEINEEAIKENPNSIEIMVLLCERAWAYGNQLKQEYTDIRDENARVRIRYINRFRKAYKTAKKIFDMCSKIANVMTQIEAEAYLNFHQGVYHMEKEEWLKAKENFNVCQRVYHSMEDSVDQLSKKEIYQKRRILIDEYNKICTYWISSGEGESKDSIESSTVTNLEAKLKIIREHNKPTSKDEMKSTIQFMKHNLSLESLKLKIMHKQSEALKEEIEHDSEIKTKLELYDKLLSIYRDMLIEVRDCVRQNQKIKNEKTILNLKKLHSYLEYKQKFETIERNEMLVEVYNEKLKEQKFQKHGVKVDSKTKEIGVKNVKEEDFIRLYEIILSHLKEITNLDYIKDEKEIMKKVTIKKRMYEIFKAFYLGKVYESKKRYIEAFSLMKYVLKLSDDLNKENIQEEEDKKKLHSFLEKDLRRAMVIIRAKNELKKKKEKEAEMENKYLQTKKKISILERKEYREETRKIPFLTHFPPTYQKIPCKPLFFDIAGNQIEDLEDFDLSKKMKKKWFGIF